MGYISDTARNRTHNLFRPKREPVPLGHNVTFLYGFEKVIDSLVGLFDLENLLTLLLPVKRICINFPTVYNDTLVEKGLIQENNLSSLYS